MQFHWGGGTPTYLTPGADGRSVRLRRREIFISPPTPKSASKSIRASPAAQHLETLRRLGFNRLSLGIQDFDPEVQEAIHRVQPCEMTRELIAQARALGFRQHQCRPDLRPALPDRRSASRTRVEQVLTLAPDRVALFSYAHVPWLRKQQGAFAAHLPEGMEKFRIFCTGLEKFLGAGYQYIGMDHFARPDDELAVAQRNRTLHRNFQGYTTKAGADLYGMGVSAISAIGNTYAQNYRELAAYTEAVERRGIATMRGYRLSDDDLLAPRGDQPPALPCRDSQRRNRRRIRRRLRRLLRARDRAPRALRRRRPRRADSRDEIRVTLLGRIFIRNVAMLFDPYLEKQHMAENPLFSKTL